MPLVQVSLSAASWRAHGKAWDEWVKVAGTDGLVPDAGPRSDSTLRYLLSLRTSGVSNRGLRGADCQVYVSIFF